MTAKAEVAGRLTRRGFVAGAACGCALHGGPAGAGPRVRPAAMTALAPVGFVPVDADERGLWQSFERLEEDLAGSDLLVRAPAVQRYAKQVVDGLLPGRERETRVYVVHDAELNASMAPNGMMIVHTGLLARMRDEAQFAAVLGHECGHYLRRHSVQRWRDQKTKTGIMAFVSAGTAVGVGIGAAAGAGTGYGSAGRRWIDLADSINVALVLSMLRFSRANEQEADAYGLRLIDAAGYPPAAAGAVWAQYMAERRASAAARAKRYRDDSASALSTHPATAMRLADLDASARELAEGAEARVRDAHRARWAAAIAPLRGALLQEQIALNDPGASLYLLGAMAEDGWTAELRYGEGEVYRLRDERGDEARAATAYAQAVALPDALAAAWRQHGYALLKRGDGAAGRAALARYLAASPTAADAAMVRFAMAQ